MTVVGLVQTSVGMVCQREETALDDLAVHHAVIPYDRHSSGEEKGDEDFRRLSMNRSRPDQSSVQWPCLEGRVTADSGLRAMDNSYTSFPTLSTQSTAPCCRRPRPSDAKPVGRVAPFRSTTAGSFSGQAASRQQTTVVTPQPRSRHHATRTEQTRGPLLPSAGQVNNDRLAGDARTLHVSPHPPVSGLRDDQIQGTPCLSSGFGSLSSGCSERPLRVSPTERVGISSSSFSGGNGQTLQRLPDVGLANVSLWSSPSPKSLSSQSPPPSSSLLSLPSSSPSSRNPSTRSVESLDSGVSLGMSASLARTVVPSPSWSQTGQHDSNHPVSPPPPPSSSTTASSSSSSHLLHPSTTPTDIGATTCEEDLERLAKTVRELQDGCFFYPDLDSNGARALLRGSAVGTYLVRNSSDMRFLFAITMQTERGATSVRVLYDKGLFQLDCQGPMKMVMPRFETLLELLDFHRTLCSQHQHEQFRWQESSNRQDLAARLATPVRHSPPSLFHQARVTINRCLVDLHLPSRSTDLLPVPQSMKQYLRDYPYRV